MALPWLKLYRLTGKNAQSVLGMVCLLAWFVPVESLAQGSLWDDVKAAATQVVRDKIKAVPTAVSTPPPSPQSSTQATSQPVAVSGDVRTLSDDRIEYDKINNNWGNNTPAIIENETAEMRQSATGNVLILHPFHATPAFIEKTVSVDSANASLEFSVRGHTRGDFLARVFAVPQSGQQNVLYEKTIVGSRGWYAESIDLGQYRGQSVTLRFEVHATGWHFEYAGLDYFFVRGNASLPQSQQSTQAPIPEPVNAPARSDLLSKIDKALSRARKPSDYCYETTSWRGQVVGTWTEMTAGILGTKDLRVAYDNFYQASVTYAGMSEVNLIRARRAALNNDSATATRLLDAALRYEKQFILSNKAAIEVCNGNLDASAELAKGLYEGSKASVIYGSSFVMGPGVSLAVDTVFDVTDFAVEASDNGLSSAAKEFVAKKLTEMIFSHAQVNGKTLEDTINQGVTKTLGNPEVYKVVREVISKPEFAKAFMSFMAKSSAYVVSDITEDQINKIVTAVMEEGANKLPPLTGCGSALYQKVFLQWKEGTQAVFGGYSFDAACQAHDACYSDCRMTQPDCDENLLADASAVCKSTWNKSTCISDARTFFLAVSKFGKKSFEQAHKSCPGSAMAATVTNSAKTGSDTDAAHVVDNSTSGLSGNEVAKALGSTREQDRAAAITEMVKQGAIRSPLTANELALILKGTTGGHRSYAIAQLSALMKSRLTAPEAAMVLGTVNELREQDRAAAIQSIAKANAYAGLAGDAALILEGATGGHRSFAIAELANFFKKGLSASAVSEVLGSAQQLREQDRAAAIRALVSASVPGLWGGEASEPLNGCTGGHRSYAIAQLAPRLRASLTGTEAASILGRPEELREQDRAAAIRSVVDARRLRLPFSGDELELVLMGTTGGHRSYAIGLLTQRR